MVCDICGSEGARIRRITRTYGKGEDLLVIENIPVMSCPHCAESYLTAETLHEIERIKQLSSASKNVLITIVLDALAEQIPIENAGYLALRELCHRGKVPVELLLLGHSLAQWVSCAKIEELDGSFLDRARELAPDNLRVLYTILEKQPNIEGDRNQRAFEQRIINRILKLYPADPIATEASAILANSDESLPLDFINRLPNPLEDVDFTQLIEALR